jgi:hypothetical protein
VIPASTASSSEPRVAASSTITSAHSINPATARRETALTLALRPNPVFFVIAAAASAALALVLYYPPAARLFRFAPLDAGSLGLACGLGAASVLWYDVAKMFRSGRRGADKQA